MKMKELKAALLRTLYENYRRELFDGVTNIDDLTESFQQPSNTIEAALNDLKKAGLVTFLTYLGPGGVAGIRLTVRGVEQIEDPASPVEWHFTSNTINVGGVSGGNVQVGNSNVQNITYSTVLQNLSQEIERANVPPDEKKRLRDHLAAVLGSKIVQTILAGAATGAGAAAVKHFLP